MESKHHHWLIIILLVIIIGVVAVQGNSLRDLSQRIEKLEANTPSATATQTVPGATEATTDSSAPMSPAGTDMDVDPVSPSGEADQPMPSESGTSNP